MTKLLKLSLLVLLSLSTLQAKENHQVGFKLGLTSIDNEDGWNLENGTFFVDFTFDTPTLIKPRIDLGYIGLDEDDNGGVSSLLQLAINGIYDIDLSGNDTPLTPYLLGGLGYEYVVDDTPIFESHPFVQAGFGARYKLTDRFTLVSEFKALQMFGSSNEDNEFAFMLGFDVPLFVEVIRAPVEKNRRDLPEVSAPSVPQVAPYQEPIIADGDGDGVIDGVDKCPHTPMGDRIDINGCTIVSSIVIPQEATYVEDAGLQPKVKPTASVKKKRTIVKRKRQDLKISFESNSAVIKDASKSSVKRFAKYLKNNPNTTVTIEGYTDNSGQRAKNLTLSTKRAEAVRSLLLIYGATASKIKAVGKGDLNPIADNDTESGRKLNRRIEAVIQ